MEGGDEPSLAFGNRGWHTHEDHVRFVAPGECWEESPVSLLDAILHDQFVLFQESGEDPAAFGSALDLRNPTALLVELTSPHCGDRIRIKTFTGNGDREVSVADIQSRACGSLRVPDNRQRDSA